MKPMANMVSGHDIGDLVIDEAIVYPLEMES